MTVNHLEEDNRKKHQLNKKLRAVKNGSSHKIKAKSSMEEGKSMNTNKMNIISDIIEATT